MNEYLIEAEALHALNAQGEVIILDTRDEAAYQAGHIPNALNANDIFTYLCTSGNGGYPALAEHFSRLFGRLGLTRADRVVVYEDALDNGYGQSCRGWFILQYLGHPEVRVLHGGLRAWKTQRLPVTQAEGQREPTEYQPRLQSNWVLTTEEMRRSLDDPAVKIVDVRDYAEWLGANSSPYGYDYCPRKGRLPGARWLEWYRLMVRRGGVPWFHSPADIRALAAEAGLFPEDTLHLYCFKGARTSNVTLALRFAGFARVRNYFMSWNEWSRDPALPIAEGYPDESLETVGVGAPAPLEPAR